MDYQSKYPYYSNINSGFWGRNLLHQDNTFTGNILLQEDMLLEDMEYLQQMYPAYARKYQAVIKSVIDKADYEGSFIYDQYPDKMMMQRMVNSVVQIIKNDEQKNKMDDSPDAIAQGIPFGENADWKNKECWIKELVTILLFYEILLRRKRKEHRKLY